MTQLPEKMQTFRIFLPNGDPEDIFFDSTTDRNAVANKYIAEWETFCSDNWMNDRPCGGMTAEARVKRFFQGLSDFILKGDTSTKRDEYPTMTEWKERQVNEREVPVHIAGSPEDGASSALMSKVETSRSAFLGERGYKKNKMKDEPVSGSFARFSEFKKSNLSSRIHAVTVDTTNTFIFDDQTFCIHPEATQYAPVQTEEGMHYAMDKVNVAVYVPTGEIMNFFDQYGHPIPAHHITKMGD